MIDEWITKVHYSDGDELRNVFLCYTESLKVCSVIGRHGNLASLVESDKLQLKGIARAVQSYARQFRGFTKYNIGMGTKHKTDRIQPQLEKDTERLHRAIRIMERHLSNCKIERLEAVARDLSARERAEVSTSRG